MPDEKEIPVAIIFYMTPWSAMYVISVSVQEDFRPIMRKYEIIFFAFVYFTSKMSESTETRRGRPH